MDNIIRKYPETRDTKIYVDRYIKEDFEEYRKISLDDYEKWKSGINHKTNRKIKIGGKTHKKVGEDFYIERKSFINYKKFLFEELDGINEEIYLLETERIKKEIDEYNSRVYEFIKKINLLEKWEQYIIFEGVKYGIPIVSSGIHRENNCFGLIKFDGYEKCECHLCENWNGCNTSSGREYYKCEKCNYRYYEIVKYERDHRGK